MKRLCFLVVASCFLFTADAQNFWFGPKIGPTVAFQQWNNFDRQPLFTNHAAIFIESYAEEDDSGSVYAQIGFHTRGSSIRFTNGFTSDIFSEGIEFNNISLQGGIKRFLTNTALSSTYYSVGARLEYTVNTNLQDQNSEFFDPFFPIDNFTNKFNYGISFGGGYKYNFSQLFGGFIELSFHPDISYQYQQAALPIGVTNPFTGSVQTIAERQIRNLTVELSVGINILRKVIYE